MAKQTEIRQKFIPGRNPLLELCPFCGEPAELKEESNAIFVECSNPDCAFKPLSKKGFATEELAIKEWNTRKGSGSGSKTSIVD